MKKLFLMRNPELFQGEKYLNKNKNYFEGWYFKNINNANDNSLNVTLKKRNYYLNIKSEDSKPLRLFAPVKGRMKKDVFESISALVNVTLKKDNIVIFSDTSTNCGLEIVHE